MSYENNMSFDMKMDGAVLINGEDGFSPIVEVETIEGGNRVTITDKDGAKAFDVMDGRDGADGVNGKDGQPGKGGKDGGYYAPFVVQDSTDSFTLGFEPNGEGMPGVPEFNIDLPNGANGKDGHTPEKGVDYWTPTDKQEIVDEVLSSIPVYNGEVEE